LLGIKVLSNTGSGSTSTVIAGLTWVFNNRVAGTPSVVSMSLGGSLSAALNKQVDAVVASGIVVIVAAGNVRSDACLYSPGSASGAITVGATNYLGLVDMASYYSNFGTCVAVWAPGSNIVSAKAGAAAEYSTMTGTSMAAPHVAAAAALYLQAQPTLTPAQVKSLVVCNSKPVTVSAVEIITAYPTPWVDVTNTLRSLMQVPVTLGCV
jgi:serine protease